MLELPDEVKAGSQVTLSAKAEGTFSVPDVIMEMPSSMQRVVEGSPIRFQVGREVDEQMSGSALSYVEFYIAII